MFFCPSFSTCFVYGRLPLLSFPAPAQAGRSGGPKEARQEQEEQVQLRTTRRRGEERKPARARGRTSPSLSPRPASASLSLSSPFLSPPPARLGGFEQQQLASSLQQQKQRREAGRAEPSCSKKGTFRSLPRLGRFSRTQPTTPQVNFGRSSTSWP